ncbi:hypothetical protein BABINDRAFT_161085 [Babjeviella inositovora NRRL Y-12698]|uniref:Uncharacterized protein n=1 Tax=Babjeviella inositovora NRRL Y-12698 TaxID=984486 RepID=A0A1E3QSU7_9ASCO|nr:uncharacterized protein BABINDRAFT_161085 [Babjeviella inositovora NRRL Y-12698]ODQ80092.1 hypothetical protein BABINDRAFT_161085 [Babjeviella inositovora NRRL Y-12698]
MSKESGLISKYQSQVVAESHSGADVYKQNQQEDVSDQEFDEDELLELLDDDDDAYMQKYREERISQLSTEFSKVKATASLKLEVGTVVELDTEKRLMELISAHGNNKQQNNVVCFYLPDFTKCGVMLTKLDGLAARYLSLNFYKINVLHAPFLVTKLGIKVLPVVLFYNDRGLEVNRIVGFDLLLLPNQREHDNFSVSELEHQLLSHRMINYRIDDHGLEIKPTGVQTTGKTIRNRLDDEDESDLDL